MAHAIISIHGSRFTEILNAACGLVRSTSPGSEEKIFFWKGMHADYIIDGDDYGQTALRWATKQEILEPFDFSSKKAMLWWTL
jgi:hypothetical protein